MVSKDKPNRETKGAQFSKKLAPDSKDSSTLFTCKHKVSRLVFFSSTDEGEASESEEQVETGCQESECDKKDVDEYIFYYVFLLDVYGHLKSIYCKQQLYCSNESDYL